MLVNTLQGHVNVAHPTSRPPSPRLWKREGRGKRAALKKDVDMALQGIDKACELLYNKVRRDTQQGGWTTSFDEEGRRPA